MAQQFARGDVLTRTLSSGAIDRVILPPINLAHLVHAIVGASGRLDGFHYLPASVARVSSLATMTLPAGSVIVVDSTHRPIAGAQLRLMPYRVPASDFDAFEAKIEVSDASGNRLAATSTKSFYPQGWTEGQIETAIYSAYAKSFKAGGPPIFTRAALTTPENVRIEMRVSGSMSASAIVLRAIPTAFLIQGQLLDATHVPK